MGAVVLYRDGLREECLYPYIYRAICFVFSQNSIYRYRVISFIFSVWSSLWPRFLSDLSLILSSFPMFSMFPYS